MGREWADSSMFLKLYEAQVLVVSILCISWIKHQLDYPASEWYFAKSIYEQRANFK